jgi:hypothetical protein
MGGSMACMDVVMEISLYQKFNPYSLVIQSTSQSLTDWAVQLNDLEG